ncbi:MAG: hypothetical protein PHD81_00525 [Candidatus Nanoarchaeia archaeon]|nr:hypothetical protein [Candidatus Nanoarchaeia archaeon]MDD5587574.1 hypothetical protein [Candidatus Nanoarchaeia archaeon]
MRQPKQLTFYFSYLPLFKINIGENVKPSELEKEIEKTPVDPRQYHLYRRQPKLPY